MFTLAALPLLLIADPAAVSYKSLIQATDAIARGEDEARAVALVKSAGKPGLWAMHDGAKKASGIERGRLFEAIGRFGSPEAEWALIVELKGSDADGRAGAIRGLIVNNNPRTFGSIIRQADTEDDTVRSAVVDAMVAMGDRASGYVATMLASESVHARSTGLRYLVRAGEGAVMTDAMLVALRDPSPEIEVQGLLLAQRVKDRGQIFAVSELARNQNDEVGSLAVVVLHDLGGWNANSELAGIIADPVTKESAWGRGARLLRVSGEDGMVTLLDTIARTKDDARRAKLASMAVENAKPEELAHAVDLLDDPSPSRVAAGRLVLMKSGDAGEEVAIKRIASALPELRAEIESYLAERKKDPKDLSAGLGPEAHGEPTPDIAHSK